MARLFRIAALAGGFYVSFLAIALAQGTATAELHDKNGEPVGTVTLEDTPHGVLMHAKLTNLPAGTHGFHIHAVGKCEPPFDSAGGHFNPLEAEHGFRSTRGPHPGDLPNIHVPESGVLEIEIMASEVRFDDDLFDDDGSAIVIHAGPDDYETDPAGDAGPRIACSVIES